MLMAGARFAFDTTSITEVMAEWITAQLPDSWNEYAIDNLQFGAKRLLFSLILVGQVITGGVIGVAYSRYVWVVAGERSRIATGLLVGLAEWLLVGAGLTPMFDAGVF